MIKSGINLHLSPGASIITALSSGSLVSRVTYCISYPSQHGCSWEVLCASFCILPPVWKPLCPMEESVIACGDISSESVFVVGFGDSPKEMHDDIVCPSITDNTFMNLFQDMDTIFRQAVRYTFRTFVTDVETATETLVRRWIFRRTRRISGCPCYFLQLFTRWVCVLDNSISVRVKFTRSEQKVYVSWSDIETRSGDIIN